MMNVCNSFISYYFYLIIGRSYEFRMFWCEFQCCFVGQWGGLNGVKVGETSAIGMNRREKRIKGQKEISLIEQVIPCTMHYSRQE